MRRFKSTSKIIALVCGIAALALAISSSNGGIIYNSSTPEPENISMKEKGVGFLKEKFLGEKKEVVPAPEPAGLMVSNIYVLIAGLIALILGVCSKFIRQPIACKKQEGFQFHFDTAGAGLTLGLIALLWSYMVIALVIGIVIFVVYSLLSGTVELGV